MKGALYTVDFRAIGEALDREIIDMWKYENLLPWVLSRQCVTVNEMSTEMVYRHSNSLFVIPVAQKASTSIYERMMDSTLPEGITSLWTAIPHPAADELCRLRKLHNHVSYSDFLRRNDKISQKRLFLDQTPNWREVNKQDMAILLQTESSKKGFLKRQYGSGGFTIFTMEEMRNNQISDDMFKAGEMRWFYEEFAAGIPCSIQCVRSNDTGSIIFGFSRQKINAGKYYHGSDLLELDELTQPVIKQLMSAIEKLEPLLRDYVGFFGIDFMLDGSQVSILEANVRLTAVTIPTLLKNEYDMKHCTYTEDALLTDVIETDLVLTLHPDGNKCDLIHFSST
jgi:hypothetical protein